MSDIFLEGNNTDILSEKCERAFLVGIAYPEMTDQEGKDHLEELWSLVKTMGIEPVKAELVRLKKPQPRLLVGSGKAEELIEMAREAEADLIVFDDDLSPSQQRNWEKTADIAVIDRQEVILDIFADRASTREAVLQVALARMEYSLPRLTRAWTHLSRQKGGTKGTRGEGETQLEIDRRIVLRKMENLKKELKKVRLHRATQRKKRQAKPIPTASIVGYTNSGKSTLLNALTDSDVLTEDKLFATLDPTTRRVKLPKGQELLLTDTVGFIRKLPHSLVDAFKSTLEETHLADFLIHLLDGSNPEVEEHFETTLEVLKELDSKDKPNLIVFNKADQLKENPLQRTFLETKYPDAHFISVFTGEGMDELKKALEVMLSTQYKEGKYLFPHHRHDLVSLLHREGQILTTDYLAEGTLIWAKVPNRLLHKVEEWKHEGS